MKLLTNQNNTNALKVVISSKITGKSVDICQESSEVSLLKSPKLVPQLVLDSGTHVFSSNAAAKYIFPPTPSQLTTVNYYLDLEASVIQPLVSHFNSKIIDATRKAFEDVTSQLDNELSSKEFLVGEKISLGDVVIWSTLYPLFTDKKARVDLFNTKNGMLRWFEKILKLPEVQEALKSYPIKEGLESIGNLVSVQSIKPSSGAVKKDMAFPSVKEMVVITEEDKRDAAMSVWEGVEKHSNLSTHPILPRPGERNVLITSALPYVNNVPHLGNIIGCVLSADVFARYCRMRGYNTLYVCGTDEYGTATETKALEEKMTPQEICDKYFKIHDSIYKWFNISFDHFGRTTTTQQTEICQDIFQKVYKNGYIIADAVEQLLCEKCDRYLADRFVEGTCPRCAYVDARGDQCDGCGHLINAPELIKPRCKVCQQTPILRQSKQFFLDLPKIEPKLKEWMQKSSPNWSHNAREISRAWLSDGLKPRCITRDLKWGIPVPVEGYRDKVFYVWFDAPIGYMSITKLYTEQWKKWWMPEKDTEVNLYQFMAKDNVPFHSVMFPASLLASNENFLLVNNIFATEYLNYEDGKFSKSRGVGVFGNDAQDTGIPADIWRFYLLYVRPETQDSSFSWQDLAIKNNSELLNILGNFINRALMFCERMYACQVPKMNLTEDDYELIAVINKELYEYIIALERGKLREGIRQMLSIARLGNQFMQSSQPWVLCKGTDDDKDRCNTVIGLSVNLAFLLGQLTYPYMPETSETIRRQLNAPPELNVISDKFRMLLLPGHQIGKPFPLFQKIELDEIEKLKSKFSGRQNSQTPLTGVSSVNKGDLTSRGTVASLEAAVAQQGEIVRKMKAAGKDRSQWGPQVTVLLELKRKLAEAQAKVKQLSPTRVPIATQQLQQANIPPYHQQQANTALYHLQQSSITPYHQQQANTAVHHLQQAGITPYHQQQANTPLHHHHHHQQANTALYHLQQSNITPYHQQQANTGLHHHHQQANIAPHHQQQASATLHHQQQASATLHHQQQASATLHHQQQANTTLHHQQQASATLHHQQQANTTLHHQQQASATLHHQQQASATLHHQQQASATPQHQQQASATLHHQQQANTTLHHQQQASATPQHQQQVNTALRHKPQDNTVPPLQQPAHTAPHHQQQANTTPTGAAPQNVEELENEIKKQGDLVRKLKESGEDRSVWQPEVNILLDLKQKLAKLKGEPVTSATKKTKNK